MWVCFELSGSINELNSPDFHGIWFFINQRIQRIVEKRDIWILYHFWYASSWSVGSSFEVNLSHSIMARGFTLAFQRHWISALALIELLTLFYCYTYIINILSALICFNNSIEMFLQRNWKHWQWATELTFQA